MNNIRISIILNRDTDVMDALSVLISDTLSSYFCPCLAVAQAVENSLESKLSDEPLRSVKLIGDFNRTNLWDKDNKNPFSPWLPKLPDEEVDIKKLWTTNKATNCRDEILSWVKQRLDFKWWSMNIFGNLDVILNSKGQVMQLFRQAYIVESKNDLWQYNYNNTKYQLGPLLYIRCGSGTFNSARPYITIGSFSDIWLENRTGFQQYDKHIALENTQALATRIKIYATKKAAAISEIEWDSLEGPVWIPEADRLWGQFQTIPNIHHG